MNHYITFTKDELNSTINTLGYQLRRIQRNFIYFKQYAKIHGVQHDAIVEHAMKDIRDSLRILKNEFNLPTEGTSFLQPLALKEINELIDEVNKYHDNPYRVTTPKLKNLIKSFYEIAEKEGKDVNWEDVKKQCEGMMD